MKMSKQTEWLIYDKSKVTDELIKARYNIYTRPEYQELSITLFVSRYGSKRTIFMGSIMVR